MLPGKDVCTVYHGTTLFNAKVIQRHGVWLNVQRKLTDFGRGFYVTVNSGQAKRWACVKAMNPQIHPIMLERLKITKDQYFNSPDTRTPAYLALELDLNGLRRLHGKIFPLPHEPQWKNFQHSWQMFVQKCRSGETHHYDYVYGPIGKTHPTDPDQVLYSGAKEQLALNTEDAVACLSKFMVLTFTPGKRKTEKTIGRQWLERTGNSTDFGKSEQQFWRAVHDQVMSVGKLTDKEANRMISKSWVFTRFREYRFMIRHEPAAYWAFAVLYHTGKLWLEVMKCT